MTSRDIVLSAAGASAPPPSVWTSQISGPSQSSVLAYQAIYNSSNSTFYFGVGAGIGLESTTDYRNFVSVSTSGLTNAPTGINYLGNTTTVVACSATGTIYTSTDFLTWTLQTTGTTNNLFGVGCSPSLNLTVVVGVGGTILTSSNGSTWTSRTSGTTNQLIGIVWGGSLFVTVGVSGTILTSPDGVTWTSRTSGVATQLTGICWTGSLYVVAGASGVILTSPDGITWTSRTSGVATALNCAAFKTGSTTVVVGGASGTFCRSTDGGLTWSAIVPGSGTATFQSLTWSNDRFVATSSVGTAGYIIWSTDGLSWNLGYDGGRGFYIYNSGYKSSNDITMVGSSAMIAKATGNVSTWRMTSLGAAVAAATQIGGIAYSPTLDKWVATRAGTFVYTSTDDGTTWTAVTAGTGSSAGFGITWGTGQGFVLGTAGGIASYSADGTTWSGYSFSDAGYGVCYGNSKFVMTSAFNAGNISYSTTGQTGSWTTVATGVAQVFIGVCWTGAQFVAVGANGSIVTSPDAISWTSRTSGTTDQFYGVGAISTSIIYASTGTGKVYYSTDSGVTWTNDTGVPSQASGISLYSLSCFNNRVVVTGRYGSGRMFLMTKT
jgi:Photosynthesis system II assembly factor YCF48